MIFGNDEAHLLIIHDKSLRIIEQKIDYPPDYYSNKNLIEIDSLYNIFLCSSIFSYLN